ncbi:MAG TPA: efflux RND transporter permease subunit, partial [Burkholderiales bacterium]|nr:efflux RND transporter permease subunit [Burkholderiales bacterium]
MSVSAPFIRRPIATCLLALAVLLAGALGYSGLPISALPQVDFPTIQVTTQLPGASADTMESLVTAALERQLGQIAALQTMTSTSSFGVSQITLQFELDRNIDAAAQDVQAAINAAAGALPKNLPYPPTYAKVNPADTPILTLALTSDTVPLPRISDLADTLLAQRLSEVSGVGHVGVEGGIRPAVRIQADMTRLAGYGLGLEDLRTAIIGANVAGPKGSLNGSQQSFTISADDQLPGADAYRSVVVAYRNNAPVRLSDVAQVVDGVENAKVASWWRNKPAILIDVQRQPGANIVQTVARVHRELPRLQRAIPAGIKLSIVSDRTGTIQASVRDVQFTLVLSVVLVVGVVLVFLRTFRATIIAGVALPLSLVATFGVMRLCGYSLDNLSLMALTIGTGFVIDDAIVMIENIVRHIEGGDPPLQAAFKGAQEIGFTVISLTLSLVAVFIPLLFMTGLVGRLFREFALTLTIAVVASAVVSLTLTPMMCGRLLRPAHQAEPGWLRRLAERGLDGLLSGYRRSLDWVLERQGLTLLVAVATLVLTVLLYIVVPKGFLPLQDTGLITAVTEAAADVSFEQMQRLQAQAADVIARDPDVTGVASLVGAGTTNTTANAGHLTITLRPRDVRASAAPEIVARLQRQLASVAGVNVYFQPVQDIQI